MGVTTVLLDEEILWRVFLYEYLSVQLIDKSGGCDVQRDSDTEFWWVSYEL